MSVIEYIEDKIAEESLNGRIVEEIEIIPKMYRQLMLEMSSLRTVNNNSNLMRNNNITFNSAMGPVAIKMRHLAKEDPNNILKTIL